MCSLVNASAYLRCVEGQWECQWLHFQVCKFSSATFKILIWSTDSVQEKLGVSCLFWGNLIIVAATFAQHLWPARQDNSVQTALTRKGRKKESMNISKHKTPSRIRHSNDELSYNKNLEVKFTSLLLSMSNSIAKIEKFYLCQDLKFHLFFKVYLLILLI